VYAVEDGDVDVEESLVRLIESPSSEPEPTTSNMLTRRSVQDQVESCWSCDNERRHRPIETEICAYYLSVTRTSSPSSSEQHEAESVDESDNVGVADVESSVDVTNELNAESVATSCSSTDVPATETVVKPATGDADVMLVESQQHSADAAADATAAIPLSPTPPGSLSSLLGSPSSVSGILSCLSGSLLSLSGRLWCLVRWPVVSVR